MDVDEELPAAQPNSPDPDQRLVLPLAVDPAGWRHEANRQLLSEINHLTEQVETRRISQRYAVRTKDILVGIRSRTGDFPDHHTRERYVAPKLP